MFGMDASKRVTKPCEFGEDDRVVVLASSDDGLVRIYSVERPRLLQALPHDNGTFCTDDHVHCLM